MSINSLNLNNAANTYQAQNATAAAAGAQQTTGKVRHGHHHHQAQSSDSVSLSDGARSLAAAREAVQNAPDVRDQKVAQIKQQVDSGTYSVPSSVLARNILNHNQSQQ